MIVMPHPCTHTQSYGDLKDRPDDNNCMFPGTDGIAVSLERYLSELDSPRVAFAV